MSELLQLLKERLGEDNFEEMLPQREGDLSLLKIKIQKRSEITVIMTNGLSHYRMPVPEKLIGYEYNELYFCLPSYWDFETAQGEWVLNWIQKLAKHVVEKQTWFGVGHTIPNGNPAEAISPTMQQKYLFLTEPVFLKDELQPLIMGASSVNFLAVLPIFEDEMDYKMGKGTYKFQKKLHGKGISELLDDYRMSSLKSKWRFFSK